MTYKIDGMICNACKKLIEMAFEDHGYNGCDVDLKAMTLTVPEEVGCDEAKVIEIVESAGAYSVIKE